jgi:hypothetical protein
VLRVGLFLASTVLVLGASAPAGPARAQETDRPDTLFEIAVPGGVRAAAAVLNDRVPPDRSQFLLEVIRRSYIGFNGKTNEPDEMLRSLVAHIEGQHAKYTPGRGMFSASSPIDAGANNTADTVPLPLAPEIWRSAVFGGRSTSPNPVSEILQSRTAARLYYALMSLDDDTRAWLATEPRLIAEIASRYTATFLIAAPGLRIRDGAIRVPGGDAAGALWESLAGHSVSDPAGFIRALVAANEGRLAYFFSAVSQLTSAQIRYALKLDADPPGRIDAARRLYSVFDHVSTGWKLEDRPFWRPALDPALLVADLSVDAIGRPVVPGTQRLWTAVFADADPATANRSEDNRALVSGDPVDFVWLCEQVFKGSHVARRRPYQQVLFASRMLADLNPATARDTIDALRAAAIYPSLVATLERAGVTDIRTFASAARRASRIATIGDDARLLRALAQFQGALVFITRASMRVAPRGRSLDALVSSLAAVEQNDRGEYDGRLVRWLVEVVDSQLATARPGPDAAGMQRPAESRGEQADEPFSPGSLESKMLALLAGPRPALPQLVEWEGTRYRVDLARAERTRLAQLLGDRPLPYVSSAQTLATVADALADTGPTTDPRHQLGELERVSSAGDWDANLAGQFQRAKRDVARGSGGHYTAAISAVRALSDHLLARGLTQFAYAVAMGQRDRAVILADDAASRHDFGLRSPGADRSSPWQMPTGGAERMRDWRATGSLLGLDVRLAEFSLVRLSSKPPINRPTLNDMDRRLLTETAVLVEPSRLTDTDRDALIAAIAKGRERLTALRTTGDITSLADDIRLSAIRRTELSWIVAHDPGRLASFLSPTELLWLGLGATEPRRTLNAWGAPAEGRTGCVCLQLIDRRPLDTLTGRWESGILASGFADLNLRLTELLAELKMPASLLGPVLASATLDFVTNAVSRDPDDRRGLVEFVHALRSDRVEQYLALLTTDGPLVPITDSSALDAGLRAHFTESAEGTTGDVR